MTNITERERIDYTKAAISNLHETYMDAQDMRYILHGMDYASRDFAVRFAVNVSDFTSLNYTRLRDVFPWLHMDERDIASALYEIVTEND